MRHFTLILAALLLLAGCKTNNMKDNPFFSAWETPYGIPDFQKIKLEHYLPAFEKAIEEHNAEIDAIVNSTEAPTFKNTIEALERSGELLNRVEAVFFNLLECENNDEMNAIAEKVTPMLSAHADDISLNAALFARIKSVYDQRDQLDLTHEQQRLLDETYKGFVRGGANVPAAQQEQFRNINEKLASLTLRFGQNVLKATNAYTLILSEAEIKDLGLTDAQITAAREEGDKNDSTRGKYVFTLHNPSWEPFMQRCSNRELRQQMWQAYATRCNGGQYDNNTIIDSIVTLRLQRAQMLGYATHADYVLDDNLAKNPRNVYDCLDGIWHPALKKAKAECAEYKKMLAADGYKDALTPADWRYYSERLRAERYALNDDEVRPYFSLDSVLQGAFSVANKLYNLSFHLNNNLPSYNSEARSYEVMQDNDVVAILYMDFFPRASKSSGAWMTEFRTQHRNADGSNVIPIIQVVANFTRPTASTPSLLTFDESETLFHEFGHAIHGMLSQCTYTSLAGTNTPRDFVEMPSQLMENWCRHPEVMRTYARHYQTGEPIPDSIISKIRSAQTFGQGFINAELLAASYLDMDYHTLTAPMGKSAEAFEQESMTKIGLIPEIISRYKSPYYQHIFNGGYSSGYYCYTWTAILDADAFQAFVESGDLYNPSLAKKLRHILSSGNTIDLMDAYRDFRGKDPTPAALLHNRGLDK